MAASYIRTEGAAEKGVSIAPSVRQRRRMSPDVSRLATISPHFQCGSVDFHISPTCQVSFTSTQTLYTLPFMSSMDIKKMNGEKNNYLFNIGTSLGLAMIISSMIVGWAYSNSKKGDEAITVTGSAKRRISSDLVVWNAGVSAQAPVLADAYKQLADSVPQIKQYLLGKGIPENQMTVSSITTAQQHRRDNEGNETSEITGYALSQQIEVRSSDVAKIGQIAREATELINQGILIESAAPRYYYTQIGDLKIEMLGEAAKDAKERAARIAQSTGNSIGAVRSAKMGVLQITAADSTDVSDYGVYDTSTIEKDMTAVVNVSFAVD